MFKLLMAVALVAAGPSSGPLLALGCPYLQAMNKAATATRRLDTPLPGSPALDNNAFESPGLTTVFNIAGMDLTVIDIMAYMSGVLGTDMCYWALQQLPPPFANYSAAPADSKGKLLDYGTLAARRLQALAGRDRNSGIVWFAAVAFGSELNSWLCNQSINTAVRCDATRRNQQLRWPQAITGFRVNASITEQVRSLVRTWRTSDGGHLPMLNWVFNGGNTSQNGSIVAGWGTGGGLRAKVVSCSSIPQKFFYQTNDLSDDYIAAGSSMTCQDEAYLTWKSLCSLFPYKAVPGDIPCGSTSTSGPATSSSVNASTTKAKVAVSSASGRPRARLVAWAGLLMGAAVLSIL